MKRTIIFMSFISLLAITYSLFMYKKADEASMPAIAALIAGVGSFAIICLSLPTLGDVLRAEDVLSMGTEYEIMAVVQEGEEFIIVAAESLDMDDDSDKRIHIAIRIDKGDHSPEVGKFFHVDSCYHLWIDGTRAEIKASMGAS